MRLNMPRKFYIPKTAKQIDAFGTDAAVYVYDENHNRPIFGALAFHGKANKPDWHYTFKTEERRAQYIADYLKGRKERAERMATRRQARKDWVCPYKVGDIFRTSWGYDQTNIEYFELIEIRGKVGILREIAQMREETGFMQGKCVPIPGKYIGEPTRHIASEYGFKMSNWGRYARKIEPTIVAGCKVYGSSHWTAYA